MLMPFLRDRRRRLRGGFLVVGTEAGQRLVHHVEDGLTGRALDHALDLVGAFRGRDDDLGSAIRDDVVDLVLLQIAADAVDRGSVAHHRQHMVDVQPARDREAGEGGGAEAGALLVHECHHRQRVTPAGFGLEQRRGRLQRRHHAQRESPHAAQPARSPQPPGRSLFRYSQ